MRTAMTKISNTPDPDATLRGFILDCIEDGEAMVARLVGEAGRLSVGLALLHATADEANADASEAGLIRFIASALVLDFEPHCVRDIVLDAAARLGLLRTCVEGETTRADVRRFPVEHQRRAADRRKNGRGQGRF
jgi:hypothetical protein